MNMCTCVYGEPLKQHKKWNNEKKEQKRAMKEKLCCGKISLEKNLREGWL